jgi:CheY-like chemotaxis protein
MNPAARSYAVARNGGSTRVLVVDDLDEMRTVIRRMLSTHGYQVDVASTLAEARSMDPGAYDAVIVDAHLGADRGTDLIATLLVENPAAAQRCLVITGGPSHALPAGVPYLVKPFQPGQLLAAVRGLSRPDSEDAAGETAVRGPTRTDAAGAPGQHADSAHRQEPAPKPRQGPGATRLLGSAAIPLQDQAPEATSVWQLLAVARRRRAREGGALADFVHDGPIQQLAAATLALHMLRGRAPPSLAVGLDEVLDQLNTAARSLRWLIDKQWQPVWEPAKPAMVLKRQTAWLLAEPLALDIHELERLGAAEVSVIVDVVELMLLAAVPGGMPATAHAAVVTSDNEIEIKLTVKPADDGGPAASDATAAQAALSELACALGTDVRAEFGSREWRARIVMPRQAAGAPNNLASLATAMTSSAWPAPRAVCSSERPPRMVFEEAHSGLQGALVAEDPLRIAGHKSTRTPGWRARTRSARSCPIICGITTSVSSMSMGPG